MKKNIIKVTIFTVLMFGFAALNWFMPKQTYSDSERRALAPAPEFSASSFLDGSFGRDFESYATDAVPFRDSLRSVKAYFSACVLGRSENNGIFESDGHISKVDSKIDETMLDLFAQKMEAVTKANAIDSSRLHFAIVPDKNYYILNGYPAIDYELLASKMQEKMPFAEYIDIYPYLDADSYYRTDTHWRQEKITRVALALAKAMGADINTMYNIDTLDNDFYGVYAPQYAKKSESDTIKYLTNETLKNAKVSYVDESGMAKEGSMYDMDKAFGKDAYEMFLSGSMPVVYMENPNAKEDKELVIFRDSYGSSLAPLLMEGYSRITLLDIRYMNSMMAGAFADFENADVLLLYSANLINTSSTALR